MKSDSEIFPSSLLIILIKHDRNQIDVFYILIQVVSMSIYISWYTNYLGMG